MSDYERLNIKQEPLESDISNDKSLIGKAIDFQYVVKPKLEPCDIKTENNFDVEGEVFEYEEPCGLNYSTSLIAERSKTYICIECNGILPYENHHVHEDYKLIISQQINEENPYHCKECNILFTFSNNALHHLFLHDRKIFNCIHCSYTGDKLTELNNHLKVVHSEIENTSKSKILSCHECNFKTSYHLMLSQHISSKHDRAQYLCKICNRCWPDKNHVLHEKVINITRNQLSEQNPYECDECKIKLFKSEDIYKHLKVHDIGYYYCTHCAFRTDNYPIFLKHKQNEHLDQEDTTEYIYYDSEASCSKCKLLWPDANHDAHVKMLKLTERGVSEEMPYSCISCKRSITDIKKAYYHLTKRCIKLKCNKCSFAAMTSRSIYFHQRAKHKNPNEDVKYNYFCNLCDYKSVNMYHYRKHQDRHKKESEKVYYHCDECDFKTSSQKYIDTHKSRVHRQEIITCDKCGYITNCIQNLKKHSSRHNREEIYNCDQCVYSTHHKSYLRNHKVTMHMSQRKDPTKTYICEECAKVFAGQSNLKRHLFKVHNKSVDGKHYICYHCNYETMDKRTFIVHVRKHLINKITRPYIYCANCDYKTYLKSHLIQHMVKHTDPSKLKMHKCSICSFETKRPHTLRAHILTH